MTRISLVLWFLSIASVASAQPCLHGSDETSANRSRREQALRLAVAINQAQLTIVGPRQGRPPFRSWEELTNIPPTPEGFVVQFQTNGQTYSFSIKDRRDVCQYAIFSDQDRAIYEATPIERGIIVPLTTEAR